MLLFLFQNKQDFTLPYLPGTSSLNPKPKGFSDAAGISPNMTVMTPNPSETKSQKTRLSPKVPLENSHHLSSHLHLPSPPPFTSPTTTAPPPKTAGRSPPTPPVGASRGALRAARASSRGRSTVHPNGVTVTDPSDRPAQLLLLPHNVCSKRASFPMFLVHRPYHPEDKLDQARPSTLPAPVKACRPALPASAAARTEALGWRRESCSCPPTPVEPATCTASGQSAVSKPYT